MASAQVVSRNLAYAALSQVISLVLMIITIPIVLHGLGASAYGIFVLANLLLSYGGFLDLGVTPSVVRLVAIHFSRSSPEILERIIGTALSLLLGLGLIGAAAIYLVAPWLVHHVLQIPPALQNDAIFVLHLAAGGFGLNICLTLFGAIPQGLQRLDLFTVRGIVLTAATAVGQIAAVVLNGGLRWVASVTIAVNVLSLMTYVLVARRLLPRIRFRPGFDRWAFKELISFGSLRFVNQISGQIVFQLDRVIVGAFLPIRAVTFYAVPLSIAQKFTVIQFVFSGAFFPAAAELDAHEAHDRLRTLYLASLKLSVVLLLPLVILVAGFATPILSTWIGADFGAESHDVLLVLAIAYGVATLIGVPTLAADATGHVHWSAAFASLSAILNLSLTLLLVPILGTIGAAYALLINNATQGLAFIYLVQRRFLRIRLGVVVRVLARPLAASLVLLPYAWLLAPRIDRFSVLVVALTTGLALYASLTLVVGVWDKRERRLASALWNAVFSVLRNRLAREHERRP